MLRRRPPTCCAAARCADVLPQRAGNAPPAARRAPSASRLSAASLRERRQVRARPQAVHVRLAGARVSPPSRIAPERASRSWMRISAVGVRGAGRRRRAASPVGQHDDQAPDADPACGREHDPHGDAVDQRPGRRARPGAGSERPAHRRPPAPAPRRRPWRRNRRAAQPQPKRVPVDERDRLLGHERMAQEHAQHLRSVRRPPPQDEARAEQRLRRPGARRWRSAGRSASSRTWTA